MSRRKVVIDTDPGLDDAVAILFALACGRFDVLGLTTVAGNIGLDRVTANAGRLLALMQRDDVPVIAGSAGPLVRKGIDEAAIHGDDGLGGVRLPEPLANPLEDATGWLAERLAAEERGTVDVLALGPLTNLAHLVGLYPQVAARIGRVIVMGGAIAEKGNVGPRSEFNFASDPEAVDNVLRSGLDLTIVPLDVTRKVRASRAYAADLAGSDVAARAAADLITAYFKNDAGRESRPLHDPCVMLLAVAPQLFRIRTMSLSVDLGNEADAGALIVGGDDAVPVKVAVGIEAEWALALLAEGLR
ncbi:nucleoside hydrolase [Devosia nitrariae]|uniref:Ribosylpyrimidine nucleosidase n=1 Tax=Devosia nitrariae TaxID=2071872 RepID=A0ABQ5W5R1_9HYPH|nr:nucleoside hydrolase [Devosia nitrariae]GLQ55302.1 ribosylpyrimidine nucleosidase [Devosia nitrariae]